MCTIKTLVFMDLESSGLPSFRNPKSVRCTEVSFVAIHRSHFDDKKTDFRILNKINLCLQPNCLIDPEAAKVTGLDNFSLQTQQIFSTSTSKLLQQFLDHLEKPVCLLAHNGNKFDFPLLKAELLNIKEMFPLDVLCLDTYPSLIELLPPVDQTDPINASLNVQSSPNSSYSSSVNQTEPSNISANIEDILERGRILRIVAETTPPHDDAEECSSHKNIEMTPTKNAIKFPRYSPQSNLDKAQKAVDYIIDLTVSPSNQVSCLIDLTDSPLSQKYPVYSPKYKKSPNGEVSPTHKINAKRTLFPNDMKNENTKSESNENQILNATPISEIGVNSLEPNFPKRVRTETQKPFPKGYRLKDLYIRLLGVPLLDAHEAEVDAVGLMKICHKVEYFSKWMDMYATPFSKVKSMW